MHYLLLILLLQSLAFRTYSHEHGKLFSFQSFIICMRLNSDDVEITKWIFTILSLGVCEITKTVLDMSKKSLQVVKFRYVMIFF